MRAEAEIEKEMNKKILIPKSWATFVFALFIFQTSAFATITKTETLYPIQKAMLAADLQTLIVFDVDEVLIVPKDQFPQRAYEKEFFKNHSKKESRNLESIIYMQRKSELVDPKILEILNKLKQKNIKTIALTAAQTGSYGQISSLEDRRINELKSFGIDFKASFSKINPIKFVEFKTGEPNRFPAFKAGILFSMHIPKGAVLKAFLDRIHWHPKSVIFVDDRLKNLESVAQYCKDANIIFTGFQYVAVEKRPIIPLNQKRVKFQFEVLAKEKKWLSDSEADAYLQRHNSAQQKK